MTYVDSRTRATRTSTPSTLARAALATLLALAAPAVSFLPALTTNIHGSAPDTARAAPYRREKWRWYRP